ncbi:MAG: Fic family protein [Clostridia bacterium]|nr:Fic family protein [Clostridia bacterium]
MNFLDVWEHPELFKDFDFSELDIKIKQIQSLRKENDLYHKVIKELNNRIDIDFIKESELIEGEKNYALRNIVYDENCEDLYETDIFKKVKNAKIDDFFFGNFRTILKNGRLEIYRKDPQTGTIYQYKSGMPTHLKALKDALDSARKEQLSISNGSKVDIKSSFIEKLHEELFKRFIEINLRVNKIPGGPPIKPAGYGEFRETIYINNNEHKYNVEVDGAGWTPTDSNDVRKEMEKLLNYYNNSTLHPILKAIIFKACFIRIHPFRDGNGRLSRILLNYMFVREGYPTIRIRGTHKEEYFNALDTAIINNDYTALVEMVKNEINQRCDQYLSLFDKLELQADLEDLNNIELSR